MKTEPNEPINPSVVKVKCDYAGNKTAEAMLPEFENKQLVGMTKREYFAAMAMQGLVSSTNWSDSPINEQLITNTGKYASEYADALIEALNK